MPKLPVLHVLICLSLTVLSGPIRAATQFLTADSENGFFPDSRTSFDFTVTRNGGVTSFAGDLADGTLKLSATQPTNEGIAGGDVRIADTLTLNGLVGPTLIHLQMAVDGSLSGPASTVNASLFIGGPGLSIVGDPIPTSDFESPLYVSRGTSATVNDVLTVSIELTPEQPSFSFMAELNMQVGGPGGAADLSHTATLSLVLPAGVSFTSASGVFLAPIPLPGAVWLFSSGLIAVCGRQACRQSRSG